MSKNTEKLRKIFLSSFGCFGKSLNDLNKFWSILDLYRGYDAYMHPTQPTPEVPPSPSSVQAHPVIHSAKDTSTIYKFYNTPMNSLVGIRRDLVTIQEGLPISVMYNYIPIQPSEHPFRYIKPLAIFYHIMVEVKSRSTFSTTFHLYPSGGAPLIHLWHDCPCQCDGWIRHHVGR